MGLIESFRVCGMVVAQVNAGKLVSVIADVFCEPVTDDGFPNSFHLGGQGGMKRERKILRHMVLPVLLLGASSGTRVLGQAQQFGGETDRSFVNGSATKMARENYQRALSQYRSGRYQEALSSLQEALKLDPNFHDAEVTLGLYEYVLGSLSLMPVWWLQILAGYGFGLALGIVYSLVGATLGALASFFVSRTLLADYVHKRFEARHAKLRELDVKMGHNGLLIVTQSNRVHGDIHRLLGLLRQYK